MKQITQIFVRTKDCKHSTVFSPALANPATEKAIAQAVYLNNAVLPPGTTQVKLTLSIPEGGNDLGYHAV